MLRQICTTLPFVLALLTAGCGSDGEDDASGLNGTYQGKISTTNGSPQQNGAVTWKLSQTGDAVKGTYTMYDGTSGTIVANITQGNPGELVFSGEVDQTKPCFASFIVGGTVTNDSHHIDVTYVANFVCEDKSGFNAALVLDR